MDIEQIKELMTQLGESNLKKLVLKDGDFALHLEKETCEAPVFKAKEVVSSHIEPLAFKEKEQGKQEAPGNYVISPMVGTFYSSPAPSQPVFVKVGDRVDENTVVCIIEAMKVMNEVKAGIKGTVSEILIDNAQPVEFGTRLIRVT